jgi:hypothetical protein
MEATMARITNKDEVLKHTSDFHAQHYKIAELLIGAYAVGVTPTSKFFGVFPVKLKQGRGHDELHVDGFLRQSLHAYSVTAIDLRV